MPQSKQQVISDDAVIAQGISRARFACMTDLFFLAREVLGYTELDDQIHKPLCDIVQSINHIVIRQAKKRCPLYYIPEARGMYHELRIDHSVDDGILLVDGVVPRLMSDGSIKRFIKGFEKGHVPRDSVRGGGGEGCERAPSPQNFAKNFGLLTPFVSHRDTNERLFLLHRGSFKTTVITIAHTIQLLLLWPEIRIAINSHKKEGGSQPILQAIRTHFKANKYFRVLFSEYCPDENSVGKIEFGTQDKVSVMNRLSSCAWPEASVEIAGLTTDMTGRHYDYIKNDDLVTRDSVTNESMIQKTREFKSLQRFLFNQPEWGVTDNIGTIYHFNDLWCELDKRDIMKVKMPIWDNRDDMNIVFKNRFTREGVLQIKNEINDYEFSCQYELNPIPPESQTFRPQWLERLGFWYTSNEISEIPMNIKIFIDPANSRRKKSDYTAWFVLGVDDKGTKYLLDIGRDKLAPEDRTNLACDLCELWKVHCIYYETIGFQDTDRYIIDRKMRERKWYIRVEEIKASSVSKEDRIKGLQPLYERGDIRWPKEIWRYSTYHEKRENMIEALRDEMMMFPKCIHDDMLDVHSFMLRVDEHNARSAMVVKKEDDMLDTIRKRYLTKPVERKRSYKASNRLMVKHRFSIPSQLTILQG